VGVKSHPFFKVLVAFSWPIGTFTSSILYLYSTKAHLTKGVNWEQVQRKECPVPFKPSIFLAHTVRTADRLSLHVVERAHRVTLRVQLASPDRPADTLAPQNIPNRLEGFTLVNENAITLNPHATIQLAPGLGGSSRF
jgi:hypothetical protein